MLLGLAAQVVIASRVQAQTAEAVAHTAQAITVRIEGATQGSGVLVKKEGNTYTVLTAWHVVSGQKAGEELSIITNDNSSHLVAFESISRLGKIDLAVLKFKSVNDYQLARLGQVENFQSGNSVFVSGYPLASNSIPARIFRFTKGDIVANANVAVPGGHQLLYSNPTLPGMSGGAVLSNDSVLIGIHASAERDAAVSRQSGKNVASGVNQAVPITYYELWSKGKPVIFSAQNPSSADDFLVLAGKAWTDGNAQETLELSTKSLALKPSAEAYSKRASAKKALAKGVDQALLKDALIDINKAIDMQPREYWLFSNRGMIKDLLKDHAGALSDHNMAIRIKDDRSSSSTLYLLRGGSKYSLGDISGMLEDINIALDIDPFSMRGLQMRSIYYFQIKEDVQRGCEDLRFAMRYAKKHVSDGPNSGVDWVEAARIMKSDIYKGCVQLYGP
ncbi:trypsin-like peptidase domain protein [Synechococcus sp. Minos11]|nr:trypsin-like peptidase domain protein [Synechococcus sp. Minos11]